MNKKVFKSPELSKLYLRLLAAAFLIWLGFGGEISSVAGASNMLNPVNLNAAPPKKPGQPPTPSANLMLQGLDKIFNPNVGNPGQPVTYTFNVTCDPVGKNINARDAFMELTLFSSQNLVSFSSTNPGWKLRDPSSKTLDFDLGTVQPGDSGTITVVATVPTDYYKPIMEQVVYLNWQDDFQSHNRGFNLLLPLNLSSTPPQSNANSPTSGGQNAPSSPIPGQKTPQSGPFAPQPAPPADQQNTDIHWFIPATKHNLDGDFLAYWLGHGSVIVLGYPISEKFVELDSGLIVQYFERGVMEYHPENNDPYRVLLKSLGRESGQLSPGVSGDSDASPSPSSIYFGETGHWLDSQFVEYWQNYGGLEQFGFPISEPVVSGGKIIQWTERARFEIQVNPNFTPLVQLGLVGVEFARLKKFTT